MKLVATLSTLLAGACAGSIPAPRASSGRPMENLGRGVVAVRSRDDTVLVSWRLLGLDPEDIGFNVYRSTGDNEAELVNSDVLYEGTNIEDLDADLDDSNTYFVKPVIDDEEQDASGEFTLAAGSAEEPVVRVPLESGDPIKWVWVGDLDGDGEYDFIVDRHGDQQGIEAYLRDGTRLWSIGLGPNSENQDNIEPGSTAISTGNWDGVTAFDLDSDGYAEVVIRISNGVTFGDGSTFDDAEDDEHQFIAVIDGQTGVLLGTSPLPDDFIDDGPLAARLGVGYLDGTTPHIVAFMKNRQPDAGDFNRVLAAWTWDGSDVTEQWTFSDDSAGEDGHNTRIIDVDGDGIDEVGEISFLIEGDGTLRYSLQDQGIAHGDRWYIAKMDPEREGLQGYGIQQDDEDKLYEYYYDATEGTVLWKHYGDEVGDVGRGLVGDIDPNYDGMEAWSFSGLYNAPSNELTQNDTEYAPWPALTLWWDGDELAELYNDGELQKWDPNNPATSDGVPGILSISDYGAIEPAEHYPGFVGDILGDWREELVAVNEDYDELVIFTTDVPTDVRLYTLAHNPAYRNAMTLKGYMQSHELDYFLGHGMESPPTPDIYYVGT